MNKRVFEYFHFYAKLKPVRRRSPRGFSRPCADVLPRASRRSGPVITFHRSDDKSAYVARGRFFFHVYRSFQKRVRRGLSRRLRRRMQIDVHVE